MSQLVEIPEVHVIADGHWPQLGDDALAGPPALPGFIGSSFSPLVAVVADRCLQSLYGEVAAKQGEKVGIVLVSRTGDRVAAEQVRQIVADGKRVGPLHFFQSVPNSVAGYVAARWGLHGPVVCLNPPGHAPSTARQAGFDQAALLIADGDADQVLVVLVEQASQGDTAVALLVSGGDLL
ncbi:beta-ketoacyl synthase chain length factor [Kribbella sp. NPDC056861]|uniref:beta-ketoacyl synthase chain length factor n=1 Tax=Kribbella sp. NPDC056861 TaxID=3154857 RepID=UPI003445B2FF